MTHATWIINGDCYTIELREHAKDAKACAAISLLCNAILNTLGDVAEDVVYEYGLVRFSVRARQDDGYLQGILDVLYCGLDALQQEYPEQVQMDVCRVWGE